MGRGYIYDAGELHPPCHGAMCTTLSAWTHLRTVAG